MKVGVLAYKNKIKIGGIQAIGNRRRTKGSILILYIKNHFKK